MRFTMRELRQVGQQFHPLLHSADVSMRTYMTSELSDATEH